MATQTIIAPSTLTFSAEQPEPWYAIRTKSRHEKIVGKQLGMDGLEYYLPLIQQSRQWSDRKKLVDLPIFPGYVFVRLPNFPSKRLQVLRNAGVIGFVGGEKGAASIPDEELSGVRLLLSKGIPHASHPYLKIGQRIRVANGSLQGLEGVLVRVGNKNGLVVSIDLIQRSLVIELQGFAIETI